MPSPTADLNIDDEPKNPISISDLRNVPEIKRGVFNRADNYEYDSLPFCQIMPDNLDECDRLGSTDFSSVCRGIFTLNFEEFNRKIPVAIKKIHIDSESTQSELLKEAEILRQLNHPHIIKCIGSCLQGSSYLKLVFELAKLGPLHKYLRDNQYAIEMDKIVKLCYQIALAMEYLASKCLVHRDLAARNVLVISEDIVKVSDFGMSRKLNEKKYYVVSIQNQRWPFKWYPPDVYADGVFDEKSDVWSFGVTCWEATSYGGRPYQGMDINTLLLFLHKGERLQRPPNCPPEIFDILFKCWIESKKDRPTFSELVKEMRSTILDLYNIDLK